MEIETKINEVRTRLLRAERNPDGKLVAGRLHDDLVSELEELLGQNAIRRPELSERLGLTLLQLTHLEDDIFQLKRRQEETRKRQEQQGFQDESEILESIQFSQVTVKADDCLPIPKEAVFSDPSKLWIRIVSMSGLKVEVNRLDAATEILKLVLQAHCRPRDQ